MWKNASDVNDIGESIRLYQPIQYKFTGKVKSTVSLVGGSPSYFESDDKVEQGTTNHPNCRVCGGAMHLLVQLHVPSLRGAPNQYAVNRSLYVFSCNRAACGRSVFAKEGSNFSLGGGGTILCRRSQDLPVIQDEKITETVAPTKSPWGADCKEEDDDDNDWGVEDDDQDNMENMEAMLQDMEVSGPKGMGAKKKAPKKVSSSNSPADPNVPRFTCYEIRATQEPGARKVGTAAQSLDDDDVGIAAAGSDAKIQQMLARYMAEEDDEEILSALRGSAGGGGNGTEKDERLPEEDRVMLAFNDRVKRSPRQVLRYAKNGTPIWSAPLPKQQQQAKKGQTQAITGDALAVPNCACGAKRIFECQLMPSLLHVLEVEKHAPDSKAPSATDTMNDILNREFVNGGLNWGAMAIYTCVDSCESNRDEFVILQNSIDGMPERRGDGNMVVAVQMDEDDCDDDDEQSWSK